MNNRAIQANVHTYRILVKLRGMENIQAVYRNFKMKPGGILPAFLDGKLPERTFSGPSHRVAEHGKVVS